MKRPPDDLAQTVVEALALHAGTQGGRIAFRFLSEDDGPETSITFAYLDRLARGAAFAMADEDMAGRAALLLYPPGIDFIAALLGCLYAGVLAVPCYPPGASRLDRSSRDRLGHILIDSQPDFILTTTGLQSRIAGLIQELDLASRPRVLSLDENAAETDWRPQRIDWDAPALLQYTSGTTGLPKGILIRHKNIVSNIELMNRTLSVTGTDIGVNWLPPYHDMGLVGGFLQPIYLGVTVAQMTPVSFLQRPVRWLEAITRYKATITGGPNFAYDLCARRVTEEQKTELDLSSWRAAINGAEPIDPSTLEAFAVAFADCGFSSKAWFPCYGLAEATVFVTGGYSTSDRPPARAFDAPALAHGHAVPAPHAAEGRSHKLVACGSVDMDDNGMRVAIVEVSPGEPASDGVVGSILIGGPSVGRRHEPNQVVKSTADDSMVDTGDIGFIHDGELFVLGRTVDAIRLGARTLYPQHIEASAQAAGQPYIVRGGVAAFTGPATSKGVDVVIVCELERQAIGKVDYVALVAQISSAVAVDHAVDSVDIVLLRPFSIPRTSSGKIQRFACRELYLFNRLSSLDRNG